MSKKIIVICYNYEPNQFLREPDKEDRFYTYGFGGSIGKNFKKFLPSNYEIEVWRLDGYVKQYYEKSFIGIKFCVFRSIHMNNVGDFSIKFLRKLKIEVNKSEPILFITHTHYWLSYQIAFFFKKCKLVCSHHGEWSPFFRKDIMTGIRRMKAYFDILCENIVFKNINYILTVDKNQIKYFKKANPKINCLVWSNGISLDFMKPINKMEARRMLGWKPHKKYILYIGKLYKFKQVDALINIWKEIQRERPEVELIIIGNAINDPWEDCYNVALKSGAVLLGRISNKELYKYYSAVDVYVLMALRSDYFGGPGIATLESLACNTPVVSYALRNYIGDNVDELGEIPASLEDTKQAILRVLDNPGKYKNMRESIEKYYSIKAIVQRAENVFENLFLKN